jgi:hypothetical protein
VISLSLWFAKRKLRKQLKGCNYEMAKEILIRKFSNAVIPNELVHLFDRFVANPDFDTAFDLIKFDSNFLALFELARGGGFTEYLLKKDDIK